MADLLEIHDSCGLRKGTPSSHVGVVLLVNQVSDDYNVHESILRSVSKEVPEHALCAIVPDSENNLYKLYLHGVDVVCDILRKTVIINGERVKVSPLFAHFTISNVYPCIKNSFLMEVFSQFGTVVKIEYVYACPNSVTFGHVLTDKRRLILQMQPRNPNFEPPNRLKIVVNDTLLNLLVEAYCPACMTSGHGIMECPEMLNIHEIDSVTYDHTEKNSEFETHNSIIPYVGLPVEGSSSMTCCTDEDTKFNFDEHFSLSSFTSSDENENQNGCSGFSMLGKYTKCMKIGDIKEEPRSITESPGETKGEGAEESQSELASPNEILGSMNGVAEPFVPKILTVAGSGMNVKSNKYSISPVQEHSAKRLCIKKSRFSVDSVSNKVENVIHSKLDVSSTTTSSNSDHSKIRSSSDTDEPFLSNRHVPEGHSNGSVVDYEKNPGNSSSKRKTITESYSESSSDNFCNTDDSDLSDLSSTNEQHLKTEKVQRKRGRPRKHGNISHKFYMEE